jgi:glycine cleavage system regulatory protein
MDLARVIFEHGGSIAGTKKVMLENHFAMLIAVYTPPTGTSPADLAQKLASPETASRLGFEVQASLLDESRPAAAARSEKGERRRLQLRCPQRPGIVLAITELLKDGNCKMSSIDADTMEKGSEIWFELEAIIEVPAGVDASSLESALRFWTSSKDARSELIFDPWPE